MHLSESFDPQAFNFSNANWLSHVDRSDQQGQATPKSSAPVNPNPAPVQDWQSQLLPVATVRTEEDVTVLREQLEAAHQLLQYQQGVVDSLTEQLVSCQTHLTQVEHDLEESQDKCTRSAAKVEDVESVCHDLKAQLRRQQTRIGEYRQVMQNLNGLPLPLATTHLASDPSELVAFGYDPVTMQPRRQAVTKASPVKTWSANENTNDLTGQMALYRKLAAMTMAAASHHSRVSRRYGMRGRPALKSAGAQGASNYNTPATPTRVSVDLPSFI